MPFLYGQTVTQWGLLPNFLFCAIAFSLSTVSSKLIYFFLYQEQEGFKLN